MNKHFILIATLLLGVIAVQSHAQKGWEAGAWLGTSYYFGDLNTDFYLGSPGFAGGVNVRRNFNQRVCAKLSLNYGQVKAEDKNAKNYYQKNRNLSFHSSIFEITPQFEFNFLPYFHGSSEDYYTPYLLLGFSVFKYNPMAEMDGASYDLKKFGTEGQLIGEEYHTISGAWTYGGGFKFDISRKWSINIELSYHHTFTDYLDDVSTEYPNLIQLESRRGEIAAKLSDRSLVANIGDEFRQRGNSLDKDSYVFLGISVMRYFGRLECPEISR